MLTFIKQIPALAAQTDEELVLAYRQHGDMKVLADLYQRYMELVYGVCLKYLEDRDNAKDSVLAIFEELVDKLRRHEVHYFRAWLHQVARNHCLMILRKKKTQPRKVETEFVQSVDDLHLEDVMNKEESLANLQECLGSLVNQQKQCIELFYLQSKCYKSIAVETNIEVNKVKSYIQNGRRNLKICMDKKALQNAS